MSLEIPVQLLVVAKAFYEEQWDLGPVFKRYGSFNWVRASLSQLGLIWEEGTQEGFLWLILEAPVGTLDHNNLWTSGRTWAPQRVLLGRNSIVPTAREELLRYWSLVGMLQNSSHEEFLL